jgi:hypothetical protein
MIFPSLSPLLEKRRIEQIEKGDNNDEQSPSLLLLLLVAQSLVTPFFSSFLCKRIL